MTGTPLPKDDLALGSVLASSSPRASDCIVMKWIVPLLAVLRPCSATAADVSTKELLSELPQCTVRLSPALDRPSQSR